MLVCLIKGHRNEMILVNITSANGVRKMENYRVSYTASAVTAQFVVGAHLWPLCPVVSKQQQGSNQQHSQSELPRKVSLYNRAAKR